MTSIDLKTLKICRAVPTANGAIKICKIEKQDRSDAHWTSTDTTETPFTPSCYEEGNRPNRLSLDLRCEGECLEFFKSLDAWAIEQIAINGSTVFGKSFSYEEVKNMYRPCVRKSPSFDPLLRTKLTTGGYHPTRFWGTDRKSRKAPENWPTATLRTQIHIAYLYISESACGLALECTDIQVSEPSPITCPFA